MAGKRERQEKREHSKAKKGLLLALFLLLGSTVITPLAPGRDVPLASVVGAAASPAQIVPSAEESEKTDGAAQRETQGDPADAEPPEEAVPVPDSYFSDAAFVGDSRTEGFYLYSGLGQGTYFYAVGATVQSVMEKPTQEGPEGKQTILDALSGGTYGKIYIMLGVNELGWYHTEDFTEQYGRVIDRIRADHPEAEIALQTLIPVSAEQDKKHSYVNNERIVLFNGLITALAEDKDCRLLDPASVLTDENGALPPELTGDGVHPNVAGCRKWLEYLRDHPI